MFTFTYLTAFIIPCFKIPKCPSLREDTETILYLSSIHELDFMLAITIQGTIEIVLHYIYMTSRILAAVAVVAVLIIILANDDDDNEDVDARS